MKLVTCARDGCGVSFRPKSSKQRYCSRSCSGAVTILKNRLQSWSDSSVVTHESGVQEIVTVEPFTPRETVVYFCIDECGIAVVHPGSRCPACKRSIREEEFQERLQRKQQARDSRAEYLRSLPPVVARERVRVSEYKQSQAHPSEVYAVRLYPPSRVKIGKTDNTTSLLSQYRRLCPEAELIWSHPGAESLEKPLQRALARFNVLHLSGRPSEVFDFGDEAHLAVEYIELALRGVLTCSEPA